MTEGREIARDYDRPDVPVLYQEKDLEGLLRELWATGGITVFTRSDDTSADTPIVAKTLIQADGDVQHLILEDYGDDAPLRLQQQKVDAVLDRLEQGVRKLQGDLRLVVSLRWIGAGVFSATLLHHTSESFADVAAEWIWGLGGPLLLLAIGRVLRFGTESLLRRKLRSMLKDVSGQFDDIKNTETSEHL